MSPEQGSGGVRPRHPTELVRVGHVGRPHGLRGEVVLDGVSLTPEELARVGAFTWSGPRGERRALVLERARGGPGRLLVRFVGFSDRDQAASLARGELYAEPARLPDPGPGMAYTFQLVGLRVVEEDGGEVGVVAEVLRTGAHPVWVVRGRREVLVPATPAVVRRVDLEAGVITVVLPEGLEEL